MLFYHYSKEKYPELKVSRLTNNLSPEAVKKSKEMVELLGRAGGYYDHISLFIEPIPDKEIAGMFSHEHDFWKSGQRLFVHIVDSDDMPPDIRYEVVETPQMDEFTDAWDWPNLTAKQRELALRVTYKEMWKKGYIGIGVPPMIAKCKKYLGKTRNYFEVARTRDDAEYTKKKYAANVPHLMVYPPDGILKVKETKTIVIA